jgi:hypothetical protein
MNPTEITSLQSEMLALSEKLVKMQAASAEQSRNILPNLPIPSRVSFKKTAGGNYLKINKAEIPAKDAQRARAEFDRLPAVRCNRTHGWLTQAERLAIVAFWANGIEQNELARKYDVTQVTISNRIRKHIYSR